ncbi:aminoglycoside phosphotransferase family protein [Nocardia puris]|uniref:aminoglycoside phosphotransferase family protein n=1 Tax=Nocardia puris TaxID=208602 RepID=UPI002E23B0C0
MLISDTDAEELLAETRERDPDFVGHYMENYKVTTSTGEPVLLRYARRDVFHGYDARMLTEADALGAAMARGVQVPELLYRGEDFLIERYIPGLQPEVNSADQLTWVPMLLTEVEKAQKRPAYYSNLRSVYDWQQWLRAFLANLYSTLPATHMERVALLGIPPLDRVWKPDSAQSNRALTLVHSDLHPSNLLVNSTGVWILDWELAMIADPLWDAAVALHRTPWPTADAERWAAELWLAMHRADDRDVERLAEYRKLEVWKSLLVDSARYPAAVAEDPECLSHRARRLHALLEAGADAFGCESLPLARVRELLSQWAIVT